MIIKLDTPPANPRWSPSWTATDGWGEDDVFHVRFDPDTQSPVEVVVRSVATIRNVDPLDLEPLGAAVDPGTIERLMGPTSQETSYGAEVTFEYEGMQVTVDTDGHLWLEWQ